MRHGLRHTGATQSIIPHESPERGRGRGRTIHVAPHAHVDLAWYWTREETRPLLRDIFDGALLPLMEADPAFRFTQDQAFLFEELQAILPPDRWERLRSLVAEGRLEPAGGLYVQPEFAEPCGESLVRQLLYGRRSFEAMFGRTVDCLWNVDSFGQTSQLPQLALQSGIRRMAFMRGMPSDEAAEAPTEFLLRGPDGSRILCHWMAGTYFIGRHGPIAEKLALLSSKCTTDALLLPFGGDLYRHRQSAREIAALVEDAARAAGVPFREVRVSTASAFFDDVEASADSGSAALPERATDLSVPLHLQDLRGTFANRISLKLANRRAERAVLAAEALLALLGGDAAELDPLWKEVLFCQFHDILGGSCIDAVAEDAATRLAEAEASAVSLIGRRLGAREGGPFLAVLNPSAARIAPIRAEASFPKGAFSGGFDAVGEDGPHPCALSSLERHADGSLARAQVEFMAALPPWSVRSFRLVPAATSPAAPVAEGPPVLDNGILLVEIDPSTGDPQRILHRPSGRELLDGPGNLLRFEEESDPDLEGRIGSIGRWAEDGEAIPERVLQGASPSGAWVSVRKRVDGCLVEKEIRLMAGEDLVRFTTAIEVLDRRNRLVWTEFAVRGARAALHAVPFAILERPDGLFPSEHAAGFAVDGGVVAVLDQGTCGRRTAEGRIGTALLRTIADFRDYRAMRAANGFAGEAAGDCTKAAEVGRHVFRYALAFRTSKAGMAAAGHAFNHQPFAFQCTEERTAELWTGASEGFLVTSLRPADGSAVLLRGYETNGAGGTSSLSFARRPVAFEAAPLLEVPAGHRTERDAGPGDPVPDPTGMLYAFDVAPFGIRTFRLVPHASGTSEYRPSGESGTMGNGPGADLAGPEA